MQQARIVSFWLSLVACNYGDLLSLMASLPKIPFFDNPSLHYNPCTNQVLRALLQLPSTRLSSSRERRRRDGKISCERKNGKRKCLKRSMLVGAIRFDPIVRGTKWSGHRKRVRNAFSSRFEPSASLCKTFEITVRIIVRNERSACCAKEATKYWKAWKARVGISALGIFVWEVWNSSPSLRGCIAQYSTSREGGGEGSRGREVPDVRAKVNRLFTAVTLL